MSSKTRDERRQAEMDRGHQVLAKKFLARTFDPEYNPPSDEDDKFGHQIDAETRRRRDEYRSRMQAQVRK